MAGDKRAKKKLARQGNSAKKRVPSSYAPPGKGKRVGSAANAPAGINDREFKWSVADMDHEHNGDWNWTLTPAETHDFLKLLEDLTKCTWGELKSHATGSKNRHHLHHFQSSSDLCEDARKRLGELNIDDEELFRLRHGSRLRIWGRVVNAVFHIIWYDRDHRVYPTETK